MAQHHHLLQRDDGKERRKPRRGGWREGWGERWEEGGGENEEQHEMRKGRVGGSLIKGKRTEENIEERMRDIDEGKEVVVRN